MAGGDYRTSYRDDMKLVHSNWLRAWIVVFGAFLIYLPSVLQQHSFLGLEVTSAELLGMNLSRVDFALIAILGAVGLQLLTGYTGLISLGNAAFFAVGAFAAAVLANQFRLPFPIAVAGAGVFGALVGAAVGLPSLRVRGLYLLLATMALQFIAAYGFLRYQQQFYGAASGGVGFPDAYIGPWKLADDRAWYFLLMPLTVLCLVMTKNLLRTRIGRALVAVRDQDIAAGAVGINVGATKIKAFAASSFIVSVAGALFAFYLSNVSQDTFSLELAIQYVAMVIIGGMGSLLGAILGTVFVVLFPYVIDAVTALLGIAGRLASVIFAVNYAAFGLVMILFLAFEPQGLVGLWRRMQSWFLLWPFKQRPLPR